MIRTCVLAVLMVVASVSARSQTVHFTFTSNTGVDATVAIPVSCKPMIDTTAIAVGDEIGLFTPDGRCVGASVWTGGPIALIVWGDNQFTPEPDGIQSGEQIAYRIWRKSQNTEYVSVTATYSTGQGIFTPNGLYVITSLQALSPEMAAAPVLRQPADAATNLALGVTLEWAEAPKALQYRYQLAIDSLFTWLVDSGTVASTSKASPKLQVGVKYFWRVRSSNALGNGPWSAVWRFTTLALPDAPLCLSPADKAQEQPLVLTLKWQLEPTCTRSTYQLATDSFFESIVDSGTIVGATTKQTPTLLDVSKYYWRVRGYNAAGAGPWSSTAMFMTVTLPEVPRLLSPMNGAADVPLNPLFEWDKSARASEYVLHLSTDSTFQHLIEPGVLVSNKKRVASLLNIQTPYYWRVRSANAVGTSAFSAIYRFTTSSVISKVCTEDRVATEFRLEQNFPNPFNPETSILFSIPSSARVRLVIYDLLGRVVEELLDETMAPGWYRMQWNASGFGSGIYICRITAGTFTMSKMMLLTK